MNSLEARRPFAFPTALREAAGARGKFVDVLGMRLAYDETGSGPPLVCLHAVGHGAGDFRALPAHLGAGFHVVALDFPDHGASGPDAQPASASRYATVLQAFLEALHLEHAVLLGNSIGGAAALELAAARPGLVRALVLANPGGLFERSWLSRTVTVALSRLFLRGARGAWWFPAWFAAYYRWVLPGTEAHDQRARIVASAREVAPLLAEAWASFAEPSSDLRDAAARVECPVLVTWAAKDFANRLRFNRGGIGQFRDATVRTFAAGHNPFLEAPGASATALREFLSGLAPIAS